MTVYDGKGASFPSHSCYCDQYKTCYTGHFGFCTRYMTSCYWNMLAHPALPSFVPCGTRLARLNARLNAAHLLRPKRTLGQAKSNNKYSLVLVIDGCSDGSFAVEHELCWCWHRNEYMIYDYPIVLCSKNQQLRKHIETKNENSSPEFKSSSQLEIFSN